jgi:hypothetical protein
MMFVVFSGLCIHTGQYGDYDYMKIQVVIMGINLNNLDLNREFPHLKNSR